VHRVSRETRRGIAFKIFFRNTELGFRKVHHVPNPENLSSYFNGDSFSATNDFRNTEIASFSFRTTKQKYNPSMGTDYITYRYTLQTCLVVFVVFVLYAALF